MVDADRLARLLDHVRRDVDRLASTGRRPRADVRGDVLDAVKYRFVTAIEGCVKAAHHIAASEGWGAADTNADAVRLLADHGVLEADLAQRMASAVGFRNVLVHQYADVRDDLVLARLDDLEDLLDFVGAVAAWLRSV